MQRGESLGALCVGMWHPLINGCQAKIVTVTALLDGDHGDLLSLVLLRFGGDDGSPSGPFGVGVACHCGVPVLPRQMLSDEPTDSECVSEPETDDLDGRQRQHAFADGGTFGNGCG
ncbi:MAG: hypothetical protein QOE61_1184 [Micromonosporaceae bacterium]|nr:hypothetical protein [Micromonosporaceae bacterium]